MTPCTEWSVRCVCSFPFHLELLRNFCTDLIQTNGKTPLPGSLPLSSCPSSRPFSLTRTRWRMSVGMSSPILSSGSIRHSLAWLPGLTSCKFQTRWLDDMTQKISIIDLWMTFRRYPWMHWGKRRKKKGNQVPLCNVCSDRSERWWWSKMMRCAGTGLVFFKIKNLKWFMSHKSFVHIYLLFIRWPWIEMMVWYSLSIIVSRL